MKRPAPYVPLSVTFATGKTGCALQDRFGAEGLGVWCAMLAAARDGQVVFAHDHDWLSIGVVRPPAFSLLEFLKVTGRMKQTRTTRQGRIVYVQITQWERWNYARRKEVARQQKARKRAESNPDTEPDMTRTSIGQIPDLEAEAEAEAEGEGALAVTSERDDPPAAFSIGGDVDRELALAKLLQALKNADNGTPQVIAGLARRLPVAALHEAREVAAQAHSNDAGLVVRFLQRKVAEREAA